MKKNRAFTNGKAELSFNEQELLKRTFDVLRASPDHIEKIIQQAKEQNPSKKPV